MEDIELQKRVELLEQRVSELERKHRIQKIIRLVMFALIVLYIIVAAFAYSKLLSSLSF